MSQHATLSWARDGFAFRNWGATGAPGWFENSGEFGIQMCVFLPLVVAFIVALGRYWPAWGRFVGWCVAGSAVTGIVASSSRGALLGLAGVTLWMLTKSRRKVRAILVSAAFAWAVYAMIPDAQKARFERAGQDVTSVSRTDNWRDGLQMMQEYPVVGIGYANWRMYHLNHYGSQLLSHNMFIEAGAELGVPGLVAFLALIACTFTLNRRTRRMLQASGEDGHAMSVIAHGLDGALVGCLVSGFFVTVLYYPFFWINFAMTVALHRAAMNRAAEHAQFLPMLAHPAPRGLRPRGARA
jgi:O-antigen ligase